MSSETELLSVSTASKTKTMETSSTADNGQAESSGNNNENSSDIHLNKRLAEDDGPKPPTKKAKASIGPDFKTMPTRLGMTNWLS